MTMHGSQVICSYSSQLIPPTHIFTLCTYHIHSLHIEHSVQTPLFFNAVVGNTAVLYGLSRSSGSHHFVTIKDRLPGQNSTRTAII